jgi:hypothetical protein
VLRVSAQRWGFYVAAKRGKLLTAIFSRAQVYEAIALAMFAGMVVLFTQVIVPLIAD